MACLCFAVSPSLQLFYRVCALVTCVAFVPQYGPLPNRMSLFSRVYNMHEIHFYHFTWNVFLVRGRTKYFCHRVLLTPAHCILLARRQTLGLRHASDDPGPRAERRDPLGFRPRPGRSPTFGSWIPRFRHLCRLQLLKYQDLMHRNWILLMDYY